MPQRQVWLLSQMCAMCPSEWQMLRNLTIQVIKTWVQRTSYTWQGSLDAALLFLKGQSLQWVSGAHTESDFSWHCLLAVQSRELASHLDTKQHALQMWEVEMMASLPASGVLPQLSMDATPSPSKFFYHLLGSSNKWVLLFLQVILDLTKLERFKQGWIHKKQSVVLREVAFPITLPGLLAEGLREATFPILGRILRQGWEQAFW